MTDTPKIKNPKHLAEPVESRGQELFELAENAERAGDPGTARDFYEALLRAASPLDDINLAETLRRIARCHHQSGDFHAAQDVLAGALGAARAAGTATAEALVLNTQAAVEQTLGHLDRAEELYTQGRERARQVGENTIVAMVDQNLGTLANTRGNFGEALSRYTRALGAYEALNMSDRRGPLLGNIGRLHTDLKAWDAAASAFQEALACAEEAKDSAAELLVRVNITRMEIARGDYEAAGESVGLTQALSEKLGDMRWSGLIAKQRAIVQREQGAPLEAVQSLAVARAAAEQSGDRLLEAEVARELAYCNWQAKNNRETLLWLNRAHRLFEELQARHDVADVGARSRELEELFFAVVREWSCSIETKDSYTHGHSGRVAEYAKRLAHVAGLDSRDETWFEMGALLHDVGKVVVPDAILNKSGPLDADEWVVMRSHPAEGERLLADVEFPWDVGPMIRHHHEAWDGTGYPDNLQGESIPWTARVLCVADVFDALTTVRPYREAYSLERAVEIMDEMSGSTLDPELYRIFRQMLLDGRIALPADHEDHMQSDGSDVRASRVRAGA